MGGKDGGVRDVKENLLSLGGGGVGVVKGGKIVLGILVGCSEGKTYKCSRVLLG